jgi:transposase
MKLFVGLDVSLEKAAICAISEHGKRSSWSASPRRSWAGSPIRTAQSPPSGSRLVPCRKGCIARLLHLGWVRPAHGKSVSAQEVRAAFTARKAVQQRVITLEMFMRGLLRNFALKVGTLSRGQFEQGIRELAAGNPMLQAATEPMLSASSALLYH